MWIETMKIKFDWHFFPFIYCLDVGAFLIWYHYIREWLYLQMGIE